MKPVLLSPFRLAAAAFVLLACCAGCDKGRPGSEMPVFPVTGKIMVDGRPAAGARITLHSADSVVGRRFFPSAVVAEDGTFSLSTFISGDGAPAGDYVVVVYWPDPNAVAKVPMGEKRPPDLLRGRFASSQRSNLRVTVPPTDFELAPVDLDDEKVRTQNPYSLSGSPNE